ASRRGSAPPPPRRRPARPRSPAPAPPARRSRFAPAQDLRPIHGTVLLATVGSKTWTRPNLRAVRSGSTRSLLRGRGPGSPGEGSHADAVQIRLIPLSSRPARTGGPTRRPNVSAHSRRRSEDRGKNAAPGADRR